MLVACLGGLWAWTLTSPGRAGRLLRLPKWDALSSSVVSAANDGNAAGPAGNCSVVYVRGLAQAHQHTVRYRTFSHHAATSSKPSPQLHPCASASSTRKSRPPQSQQGPPGQISDHRLQPMLALDSHGRPRYSKDHISGRAVSKGQAPGTYQFAHVVQQSEF